MTTTATTTKCRRLSLLTFLLLLGALVLASVPAGAAEKAPKLSLELESADSFLTVRSSALGEIASALLDEGIRCSGDLSGEIGDGLRSLERRGEGSRYRFEEDGDRVTLRRRRGQIEVRLDPADGKRIDLSAPWAVAQCLIGDGERLHLPSDLELSFESSDSRVRVRLD